MPRVLVPLAEGFEEIEAITVVDILRRAGIDVVMAALESLHVKGAHGINVVADALLSESDEAHFDMIVLPGGLPGAVNLAESFTLHQLLQRFDKQKKAIAAICAAPLALKAAGVLKNAYTCYPSFELKIKHAGYRNDSDVIRDENIVTSKGPRTAMVFALTLVEILISKEASLTLQKDLLLIQ